MTGERPGRKVRALAARFPELGAVRYVEGNPPSPAAVVIAVLVVLTFSAGIVLGNGEPADAALVAPWWVLIAAVILWFLGSEKVVVLERGLLIGSVAPFLTPFVVPFHRLDAASVTAYRPVWKLPQMVAGGVPLRQGRSTVWGWNGVAFVASGVRATRAAVDSSGILGPGALAGESLRPGVWWFGTWRRTDGLVRALEAALADAGAPGARGLAGRALPQVMLSGNPADAGAQLPGLLAAGGAGAGGA
ncbi:hypothetical protein [Myceligenerans crystallogenes]|uniref:PH domain-containing protein n=1 Tax=Myceligenerans crystallogenes TaxID=316335 RepID=A0ABN2N2T2_9MICO